MEIRILVVAKNERGKGLGKRLMKAAEKEALKRNCKYISLDTFSFQAPGFYEKLGFQKIGIEENPHRGYDKIYYRKAI